MIDWAWLIFAFGLGGFTESLRAFIVSRRREDAERRDVDGWYRR